MRSELPQIPLLGLVFATVVLTGSVRAKADGHSPRLVPARAAPAARRGGVVITPEIVDRTKYQMKSFSRLVDKHAAGRPLAGYHVFAMQHVLGSTESLFHALAASGVPPQNIHIMSKNYSECPQTVARLARYGFDVVPSYFDPQSDAKRFAQVLAYTAADNPRSKMLIIDDGGDFISSVNRLVENKPPIKAVAKLAPPSAARGRDYIVGLLARSVSRVDSSSSTAADELLKRALYPKVRPSESPFHHPSLGVMPKSAVPTDLAQRVVAVEQTRRGISVIEELGHLHFPVVNIGQSYGKVRYESPLIGRSVSLNLQSHLDGLVGLGMKRLDPRGGPVKVLVLGYGNVGQATASYLARSGYQVAVADPKLAKASSSHAFRQFSDNVEAIRSYQPQIIVSAAGQQTIGPREIEVLPSGTVFANVASAASEFPRTWHDSVDNISLDSAGKAHLTFQGYKFQIGVRFLTSYKEIPLEPPGPGHELRFLSHLSADRTQPKFSEIVNASAHAPRVVKVRDREFLLLNGGHPVNFTGEEDPIPPKYIQLTRGLLYLGALQAARTPASKSGLHGLRRKQQRQFIHDIQAELREADLGPLRAPTF